MLHISFFVAEFITYNIINNFSKIGRGLCSRFKGVMTTFGSSEIRVLNSFNEEEIISPRLEQNNLHMIFLAIYSTEQESHEKPATNNMFFVDCSYCTVQKVTGLNIFRICNFSPFLILQGCFIFNFTV